MTLQVVGAGWGRTGTASIKLALEQLGLRCHHMMELFAHPEHSALFLEAARDPEGFDWERIYGDYAATVDWPGCTFWRELSGAYPDAKVLLTTRDPEQWFESYRATIYQPVVHGWPEGGDAARTWHQMVQEVIIERSFGGEPHDRDHLVAAFERHAATVEADIPPERLVVYDVRQGWEPLCELVGAPVPDEPFPHANERSNWGKRPS